MILERLKEYIDSKDISVAAFEKSIGMSNASFGKCLKKGGAIGTDKLENILRIYPDISASWLLTGDGEMIKESNVQTAGDNSTNINGNGNHVNTSELLDKALDEIAELRRMNQEQVRNNQTQFERFMSIIEKLTGAQ